MSIKIKQINNEYVRPIPIQFGGATDTRPIKGSVLFSEIYANIFICAKKRSGKTTVLNKIVSECSTTDTTIMVFCSTVDKDVNHLSIKQFCKTKGIPYLGYTSMKDDDIDVLDVLITKLQEDAKQQQEEDDSDDSDDDDANEKHKNKSSLVLFDSSESEEEEVIKKRKSKFRSPEYIVILDDISSELKSKILVKLLKCNRHFKMKVIVSSQYVNDLLPESLKQMDYALIFKGEPEAKLEKLWKDFDLAMPLETFKQVYYNATAEKFQFLYIDIRSEKYRKSFHKEYILE